MSRKVTLKELQEANKPDKTWIQIENCVYDATEFIHKHPGGTHVIESLAGRDATFPFTLNHTKAIADRYLKSLYVGELVLPETKSIDPNVSGDVSEIQKIGSEHLINISAADSDALLRDYRALRTYLADNGFYETRYSFYYLKAALYSTLLVASLYLMAYASLPFGLLGAVGLGMFWQQIAFLGHDLGHNGVTHSVAWDSFFGYFVGNIFGGISIGWWKYTHNVHHIRTNDIYFDPDIQHLPVLAISSKFFKSVYSRFHGRTFEFKLDPAARFFIRWQHYLFLPLLFLGRWNLYLQSWLFVKNQYIYQGAKNPRVRRAMVMEAITLAMFAVWCFGFFSRYTAHPIVYALIANTIAGSLHLQIVSNHFPMPSFEDMNNNFFIHQLQSSMAITSTVFMDWFFGGLQFQVEHHLFPKMPRHNLRAVKPFIMQLCHKYNLPYHEDTFPGAVRQIYYVLKKVALASTASDEAALKALHESPLFHDEVHLLD